MDELITIKVLSLIMKRSIKSIEKDVKRGLIPYIKFPSGAIRFSLSEIIAWIQNMD